MDSNSSSRRGTSIDVADRAQLLLEINNAVVSHLELAPLLRAVSTCLRRTMPHDFAALSLYYPGEDHLRVHGLNFPEGHPYFLEGQIIPLEGTPGGLAVRTGKPVLRHHPCPEEFPSETMRQAQAMGVKSGLVIPLIRHEQTLGALAIASFEESKYTEADVQLLMQIGAQVAISVQNFKHYEAMQQAQSDAERERDRSRFLLEINNTVTSTLDLSSLLKAVSASLRQVISHDSAFICLCNPGDTEMRVQALDIGNLEGADFAEGKRIAIAGTPEEQAMRTRKGIVLNSAREMLQFPSPMVRYAVEQGVKSGCAVPLIVHDQVLGTLVVVSRREAAFSQSDSQLLEQCSAQIAIAVQNSLNYEKARKAEEHAQKERDRADLLLEVNNALVSHLDLHQLVKTISSSLQQVLQHDFVGLALYDEENGAVVARARDSDGDAIVPFDPRGTTSGVAYETGRPVYMPRPDRTQFPSAVTAEFFERGMKTFYSVPVSMSGRKLGTLTLASAREDALSESDRELVQQIAKQVALAAANALSVRDLENLKNILAQEKLYLEDEIRTELNFDEIIGQSAALKKVLQLVETVAASDSTVLLLGETGTGKELIARAVHDHSRRKNRTFVKLNCAAIPTGLLESELFGHERGAFTGAIAQKIGRLELADQGTLFLDEVGDIPVEIQPKLLRALQEREFERLGSTHTKRVNVRLVAATNRDLEEMIADREFRSDLFYRLNVFPIRIPPLRERPEDIPLLIRYFAHKFARQMQKNIETIPAESMSRLETWHWPGNVRELENFIERSVILTNGSALQVPLNEIRSNHVQPAKQESKPTLASTEREHIIKILRETRGVLAGPNGAASRLGVKRTTLQYKMKKLGITRDHWWPSSPSA